MTAAVRPCSGAGYLLASLQVKLGQKETSLPRLEFLGALTQFTPRGVWPKRRSLKGLPGLHSFSLAVGLCLPDLLEQVPVLDHAGVVGGWVVF